MKKLFFVDMNENNLGVVSTIIIFKFFDFFVAIICMYMAITTLFYTHMKYNMYMYVLCYSLLRMTKHK